MTALQAQTRGSGAAVSKFFAPPPQINFNRHHFNSYHLMMCVAATFEICFYPTKILSAQNYLNECMHNIVRHLQHSIIYHWKGFCDHELSNSQERTAVDCVGSIISDACIIPQFTTVTFTPGHINHWVDGTAPPPGPISPYLRQTHYLF